MPTESTPVPSSPAASKRSEPVMLTGSLRLLAGGELGTGVDSVGIGASVLAWEMIGREGPATP